MEKQIKLLSYHETSSKPATLLTLLQLEFKILILYSQGFKYRDKTSILHIKQRKQSRSNQSSGEDDQGHQNSRPNALIEPPTSGNCL